MIDFPQNPTVGFTFQVGNTIYKCVAINPAVWSATVASAGIPDAPGDGKLYGRQSAAWSEITKAAVGLGNVDNTSDANKPISSATATALAGKEPTIVAGTTAQFWRGDKTWQNVTTIQPFPAGTKMLFAQSAAPTGWTQVTDDTANNRMLRVVASAGGGVGGAHDPSIMNVVPSHTHGFSTGYVSADHSHWVQTGGFSSSHLHGLPDPGHAHGNGGAVNQWGLRNENWAIFWITQTAQSRPGTDGAGTGQWVDWADRDHSHNGQSGGISANHYHSGGTDNGSSQTNWSPRYINLIICQKN